MNVVPNTSADAAFSNTSPAEPVTPQLRRVTVAGSLGVFVEFYDYGIYGFLAGTLALTFFPDAGSTAGLLMTYGIFGLTFFARPVGGLVLGAIADRVGRRPVLVGALVLMTGSTTLIGVLPGYATIGIAAPILLLVCRLLQGISAGGEVASAMSFIGEHAPSRRRGYLMSWAQVGSFAALLVGTLLAAGLSVLLSPEAMQSWGWRIPFLLAAPMGIIGYYIRRRLEDTPNFRRIKDADDIVRNPIRTTFRSSKLRAGLLLALCIPLLNSAGYYVLFAYLPTYLSRELRFSVPQGLAVTAVSLVVILFAIPPAAALSDRWGRRRVLLGASISIALAAYPCFALMTSGSTVAAAVGASILALCFAAHTGVIHATLVELFPTRVRNTAYALGYGVSIAVFGGSAPLFITALIAATGNTSIPAYYMIAAAIGTAIAVVLARETAATDLDD